MISFRWATGVTVRNNTLVNGTNRGIRFDYDCTNNKIINNTMKNIPFNKGINLYPRTTTEVIGNYLEIQMCIHPVSLTRCSKTIYSIFPNGQIVDIGGMSDNIIFKNNTFVQAKLQLKEGNKATVKNNIFVDSPFTFLESFLPLTLNIMIFLTVILPV